jgi:hypothetical protein
VALRMGPAFEHDRNAHPGECRRTHDCSKDMQCLEHRFPWMTMIDLLLCAEAWEMGFQRNDLAAAVNGGCDSQSGSEASISQTNIVLRDVKG